MTISVVTYSVMLCGETFSENNCKKLYREELYVKTAKPVTFDKKIVP
jgi:hypothetical protein